MAVVLSQFTLTKIVTISPYYVLVNETEVLSMLTSLLSLYSTNACTIRSCIAPMYMNHTSIFQVFLSVAEDATPNDKTSLPPGEVMPRLDC